MAPRVDDGARRVLEKLAAATRKQVARKATALSRWMQGTTTIPRFRNRIRQRSSDPTEMLRQHAQGSQPFPLHTVTPWVPPGQPHGRISPKVQDPVG
jgi:hypothetical protein